MSGFPGELIQMKWVHGLKKLNYLLMGWEK